MHDDITHAGLGYDAPGHTDHKHTHQQPVWLLHSGCKYNARNRAEQSQHSTQPCPLPVHPQDQTCLLSHAGWTLLPEPAQHLCVRTNIHNPAASRPQGRRHSHQHPATPATRGPAAAHAHLPPHSRTTGRQAGLAHQSHSTPPLGSSRDNSPQPPQPLVSVLPQLVKLPHSAVCWTLGQWPMTTHTHTVATENTPGVPGAQACRMVLM